ncbi:MAG: extracellular solute-binding protein [Chloroflexi bacterium]|nr:extracellular solute-binding protein [Chloroflexota bacterium]
MKTKILVLFVLVSTFVLAACAPAQVAQNPQPAAPTSPPAQPTTPPIAVPTQAPAPTQVSAPVEITFWHQYDKANADMIQELVDAFNQTHPNIKVNAVIQPSYDEYKTLIQTSILSGTSPDIAAVDLVWVPGLVASNALEPLDSYIQPDSSFDLADFYPLLAGYDVMGGKRYALPVSANNMQLIWNKDLFAKAGLDPETPPKTWNEMQTMSEKCSDPANGVIGFEFYTQPTGEGITWQFQVWLWAAGGQFLNADNTKAAFNTPEGLKALTYVSNMLAGHGSVPGPWGAFGDQKACMQLDGSWLFGYRKDAPFQWGIAAVPYPEGGQTTSNIGGEHLIMFQSSKNKAAVWEFMKYMTSADVQLKWDEATGFLPVRKAVGDNPEYLKWINDTEPRMLPFAQGMQTAHSRPATPLYTQVSDAFSREIQTAMLGQATPQEALDSAEKAVNEALSQ